MSVPKQRFDRNNVGVRAKPLAVFFRRAGGGDI